MIAAAGANVVKRIGDAVMFVTNAPGVACSLALDLLEACAAAALPKLRVGLAFGDVMVRQGDFYGPTVNLAARLVSSAEAGTALTDAATVRAARARCGAVTRSPRPGSTTWRGSSNRSRPTSCSGPDLRPRVAPLERLRG